MKKEIEYGVMVNELLSGKKLYYPIKMVTYKYLFGLIKFKKTFFLSDHVRRIELLDKHYFNPHLKKSTYDEAYEIIEKYQKQLINDEKNTITKTEILNIKD